MNESRHRSSICKGPEMRTALVFWGDAGVAGVEEAWGEMIGVTL